MLFVRCIHVCCKTKYSQSEQLGKDRSSIRCVRSYPFISIWKDLCVWIIMDTGEHKTDIKKTKCQRRQKRKKNNRELHYEQSYNNYNVTNFFLFERNRCVKSNKNKYGTMLIHMVTVQNPYLYSESLKEEERRNIIVLKTAQK